MLKNIKYNFYNPNTISATADMILNICLDASINKFEKILLHKMNKKEKDKPLTLEK